MSVHFSRVVLPKNRHTPQADWDGCWKVYTICPDGSKASALARMDIKDLSSSDTEAALNSYATLLDKAHTGQDLSVLYDEKQCHPVHEFKYGKEPIKIWRIWGASNTRIYFIYQPNKTILILKTEPKRKNKLSSGELTELEDRAKLALNALDRKPFETKVI